MRLSVWGACLIIAAGSAARADDGYRVLHTFGTGFDSRSPGGYGVEGIVGHYIGNEPSTWALYGTALLGGQGAGVVFKLAPPKAGDAHWTYTRAYVFQGGVDGENPLGGLSFYNGLAYGVTATGGPGPNGQGCGTIFRLRPPNPGQYFWNKDIIYALDCSTGSFSAGPLVFDPRGNAYGTTSSSVFQLSPPPSGQGRWTLTTLHTLVYGAEGSVPNDGGVIIDRAGNLYGGTQESFQNGPNEGIIYKVSPPAAGQTNWGFKTLYAWTNGQYGGLRAPPLQADDGTLYGSAGDRVFRLRPPASGQTAWQHFELFSFSGARQGGYISRLAKVAPNGALYGTARSGSTGGSNPQVTAGVVFCLNPQPNPDAPWTETILHSFPVVGNQGSVSGVTPTLVRDPAGTIYGAQPTGGGLDSQGHAPDVVFTIAP